MDGDPISSVGALVNEMTFRLQQIDDQGLRALAAADAPDDLPASRREGPGRVRRRLACAGVLGGVAAMVHGPDGERPRRARREPGPRTPPTASRT